MGRKSAADTEIKPLPTRIKNKEQRATTKNSKNNLVEKNVMTNKLIENTENKNSLKHKSALKGISQDLLNKVNVPVVSSL